MPQVSSNPALEPLRKANLHQVFNNLIGGLTSQVSQQASNDGSNPHDADTLVSEKTFDKHHFSNFHQYAISASQKRPLNGTETCEG
jgi:hypothetical protein